MLTDGPQKGQRIRPEDFQTMLSEYYDIRHWGEDGRPQKEHLEKLGLVNTKTFDCEGQFIKE